MVREKTCLQQTLNELMETGSKDTYATRIWSTCPRMLKIDGFKGKDEDKLTYIVNNSSKPLPLRNLLNSIQKSSKNTLKITVAEQNGVKDLFGDLYAYFLIEGHMHTTHYVSMSIEFPDDDDINANIADVSLRCKKSIGTTKTIVMVAVDSQNMTEEGQNTLKKLLEQLLLDGIEKVVIIINPDEPLALLSHLFEEVVDEEVSLL
jgi:hypothetical protein